MEFDDILVDVGDYGRYQLIILCIFIFPLCFFAGIQSFIQLFLSTSPKDYWCNIPVLRVLNRSAQLDLGIPKQKYAPDVTSQTTYSKCLMYDFDHSAVNVSAFLASRNTTSAISCQHGWNYAFDEPDTVVTTWDLVCSQDWYTTLALLCFTLGSVCGLMIFGAMSDYLGRKVTMFACLGTQIVFGVSSAFAPTFPFWCACRFFSGLTIPSSLRIPMIYAIELVRPEKRTRVGILTTGCYTLGTIVLTGIAYGIPDWRKLTLICGLSEILLLLAWWVVPESPRWLLVKNRSVEIKDFLRYTAQINGKILGSNTLNKLDLILDHETSKSTPTATIFDLFRLPNMRKKTLLITFIWFSNISVYMGLSYYSPALGGSSIYLSYLLSMIMELPAYCAVWFVTEKLGRRLPLCLSMICGGMLCVVTVALPESNPDAILVMYLMGKFCISASFFVICVYAGELYPTLVRGIGLGTSATIATLGVCLGPIIIHLGKDYMTMPLVIFGIFAILGGFTSLFLPETWHQKLPETLAEGEEFGKSSTFMNMFRLTPEDSAVRKDTGNKDGATGEKSGPLVDQTVDKDEEELAFERQAHFLRSFPQPTASKKPAVRMNSSTYLMTKQEPSFS